MEGFWRHRLYTKCFLYCFLFVFYACDDHSDVLMTLDKAERVMHAQPDSAFFLLSGMDSDNLPHGEPRARYALLYTQALDKTRRPFYNDSLINIAVHYYARRTEPLQAAYAFFYQGCVYIEMGDLDRAFRSLTEAQKLAEEMGDDYLLGLVTGDLAELYQQQHQIERALELYRVSLNAYKRAGKISHEIYALTMLGRLHWLQTGRLDSVARYYQAANELAFKSKDSVYWYTSILNLSDLYRAKKEFLRAKDSIVGVLKTFNRSIIDERSVFRNLGILYADMGQLDSARYYLGQLIADSALLQAKPGLLLYMKDVEEQAGDYKAAMGYYTKFQRIINEIVQHNHANDLRGIEVKYNNERLRSENYALRNRAMLGIFGFLILMIVMVAGIRLYLLRIRKRAAIREERLKKMSVLREEELKQIHHTREDELIARSLTREEQLKQIIGHRFTIIRGLLNLSYVHDVDSDNFVRRFRAAMALSGKPDETFFTDLLQLVNDYYYGAVDWLKDNYEKLTDSDIELICLLFFGFTPQELCVLYGLGSVGAIYTRIYRLNKKMQLEDVPLDQFLKEKIAELRSKKAL